jgi:hypothetical protein
MSKNYRTSFIQAPRRQDGSLSKKVVDILRRFIDASSALNTSHDDVFAEDAEDAEIAEKTETPIKNMILKYYSCKAGLT